MEQRRFGDTDLVCSALGFGTWEMSTTQYGAINVHEAAQAVAAALDRGITLFDTAEGYGPYHSEELLAKALGPRRKDVVLVTKVGFVFNAGGRIVGRNSSAGIIKAMPGSRRSISMPSRSCLGMVAAASFHCGGGWTS